MAIPIPADVRELLEAPNYVHLSTLRAGGSPRNWVVWVGLEDEYILVCTSKAIWKAKYTGKPFRNPGPGRVCFVIAVEKAAQRTLAFSHDPA